MLAKKSFSWNIAIRVGKNIAIKELAMCKSSAIVRDLLQAMTFLSQLAHQPPANPPNALYKHIQRWKQFSAVGLGSVPSEARLNAKSVCVHTTDGSMTRNLR